MLFSSSLKLHTNLWRAATLCYCRLCTDGGRGVWGGTAIYGYIGMYHCEGYGFQAVYCRIGYMNQRVWVNM